MGSLNLVPANTEDYRKLAEKRIPYQFFGYLEGGSYQEVTMRRNISDFEKVQMEQKVMVDVSKIDTPQTLFGKTYAMPLALAPVGFGGMMARRAEVQAKRAADALQLPFCLSTISICSMEEVVKISDTPFWFQLYMLKDRGVVEEMLQRAKDLGVKTLLFTVDLAVLGARYHDTRNGLNGNLGPWGKLRSGILDYLMIRMGKSSSTKGNTWNGSKIKWPMN